MNIPNFPTDSLYKFAAISGVFLVFSMAALLEFRIDRQAQLDAEMRVGIEALHSRTEFHKKNIEVLLPHSDVLGKELNDAIKNYTALFEDSLSLREKSEKTEASAVSLRRIYYLTPVIMLIGAVMAAWGFVMWYFKLQRHQDILLKNSTMEQTSKPKA